MATDNLNFTLLIPERDTFTDQDGAVYEFRSRMDFSMEHLALANKLQRALSGALDRLAEVPEDESSASVFERTVNEVIGMALPDLPEMRRKEMTLGQKTKIVEWWNGRNASPFTDGKQTEIAETMPGKVVVSQPV